MQFADIPAHEATKNRLIKSAQENRISHAQLFLSSEGNGALAMAIAYAQYILCSNKTNEDSCGQCSSCIKIKNLIHPDLHFSFPFVAAQADVSDDVVKKFREFFIQNPFMNLQQWTSFHAEENKQPQIGVKEASGILNKLALKSYEGGFKIMVIWLPEYMNNATANKLLKILEEPPDFTLFLLVSENQDGLLPTIISRTQLIKIPPYKDSEVISILTQLYGCSPENASVIASVCQGNICEALILLGENEDNSGKLFLFRKWMQICYRGDLNALIEFVDEIASSGRENQKNFLFYGLQLYRQCVMLHYSDGKLVNIIGEEREFLQKFSPFIMGHNISQIHDEFTKAHYHIERNGNAKLIYFNLSVKLMRLLKLKYPVKTQV